MNYRPLGTTGFAVSEIGFGAWGIGGLSEGATSYGATDDNNSRAALRRAFERGITLYDTSDVYGNGHSEELIGETLHDVRKHIVIASKVGFVGHGALQDFSPEHIRSSIEASLRRLRTDYLDLYQLHSPPLDLLRATPEAMVELRKLRQEGKVRAIGISVKNPNEGVAAIDEFGAQAVQVNFNMTDQRAITSGLFAAAENKGVGIIARTPLCFGFLTGTLGGLQFNPRDHRSAWSDAQRKRWTEAPTLFAFLNEGKSRTPAQLALKFCLSFGAVSSAIPGMLHPSEVEENAAVSGVPPLTAEELDTIKTTCRDHPFFIES